MGPRTYVSALAAAAAVALSAGGCSGDDSGAAFVDGEQCAGFTPAGSRLDDGEMLDAAATAWHDYEDSDSQSGPALADDAQVCVVYADVNEGGEPRVAMVSDDVGRSDSYIALFEGMDEDDLDVAHIDGVRYLGDDATAIGVGDGLWLLADTVEAATLHTGSPVSAHELDLSESRLVDPSEQGMVEGRSEGILVAEAADRTVVATSAGVDADVSDQVAAVALADSPLDSSSILASADGAAVLAEAIRQARGDLHQHAPPDVQLLGAVDVPEVGTVLAAATVPERDRVSPLLSIGTRAGTTSVRVGPVRVLDGDEAVRSLDATAGWAAGAMLVDNAERPLAYVVAAQPPADSDGPVRLDVRVGRTRHELSGPVAHAPADGSVAAVIGTAPSGVVVPTVPTDATVAVDRPG